MADLDKDFIQSALSDLEQLKRRNRERELRWRGGVVPQQEAPDSELLVRLSRLQRILENNGVDTSALKEFLSDPNPRRIDPAMNNLEAALDRT